MSDRFHTLPRNTVAPVRHWWMPGAVDPPAEIVIRLVGSQLRSGQAVTLLRSFRETSNYGTGDGREGASPRRWTAGIILELTPGVCGRREIETSHGQVQRT